jgi:hypothetical protein
VYLAGQCFKQLNPDRIEHVLLDKSPHGAVHAQDCRRLNASQDRHG